MTTLWRLELVGPREPIEQAGERLTVADPVIALSVSVFEVEGDTRLRRLEALFDRAPDTNRLIMELDLVDEAVSLTCAPLAEENWVAKSLEGLPPVRVGRFYVRGSHHPPPAGGRIDILIEAGEAFGTGHHGTTKGCLLALDHYLKRHSPHRILDVGTGTGVLAIAAAKATRRKVDATDIDPVAVNWTRNAADSNGVAHLVTCVLADGAADLKANSYDLVMANILAEPLILMAHDLADAVEPGGLIILSGLLTAQRRGAEAAYQNAGFTRKDHIVFEDWSTLVMVRR